MIKTWIIYVVSLQSSNLFTESHAYCYIFLHNDRWSYLYIVVQYYHNHGSLRSYITHFNWHAAIICLLFWSFLTFYIKNNFLLSPFFEWMRNVYFLLSPLAFLSEWEMFNCNFVFIFYGVKFHFCYNCHLHIHK